MVETKRVRLLSTDDIFAYTRKKSMLAGITKYTLRKAIASAPAAVTTSVSFVSRTMVKIKMVKNIIAAKVRNMGISLRCTGIRPNLGVELDAVEPPRERSARWPPRCASSTLGRACCSSGRRGIGAACRADAMAARATSAKVARLCTIVVIVENTYAARGRCRSAVDAWKPPKCPKPEALTNQTGFELGTSLEVLGPKWRAGPSVTGYAVTNDSIVQSHRPGRWWLSPARACRVRGRCGSAGRCGRRVTRVR